MESGTQLEPAALHPGLAQANLARIRGQWDEAVEACVRVLRSDPGNADAHALLGDIYRDQGALDDAIQWYRMASDLRPSGPDVAKLQALEKERERRAAVSGPATAQVGGETLDSESPGTTQLMGHSPRRWLNTMTIASACFLAATLIVLAALRFNSNARSGQASQSAGYSSHPMMPTADTGVSLPAVDPNRPTILPNGEQPRPAQKPHETGTGLEPDRTGGARTTTQLPAFAGQPSGVSAPPTEARELAPAKIQAIQPLKSSLPVAGDDPQAPAERVAPQQTRPATQAPAGQDQERDPGVERDPDPGQGTTTPAPGTGAGDQTAGGGDLQADR